MNLLALLSRFWDMAPNYRGCQKAAKALPSFCSRRAPDLTSPVTLLPGRLHSQNIALAARAGEAKRAFF